MRTALIGVTLVALVAGCQTTPVALGPQPVSGSAVTTAVPTPLAGAATLTDNDLKAAITQLVAANGGTAPTQPPLSDDYSCITWMDAQLPTWIAQVSQALPSSAPKGAVSAFIAAKIVAVNGQNTANNFNDVFVTQFAHNCGAALMYDQNFVIQALAKFGVNVSLPATGGLSGILGSL